MVDKGRRSFFRDLLRQVAVEASAAAGPEDKQPSEREGFDEFFESYESSYALTLGYPDDILLETARMEGVEVEGREKIDIVKELFLKKGWS